MDFKIVKEFYLKKTSFEMFELCVFVVIILSILLCKKLALSSKTCFSADSILNPRSTATPPMISADYGTVETKNTSSSKCVGFTPRIGSLKHRLYFEIFVFVLEYKGSRDKNSQIWRTSTPILDLGRATPTQSCGKQRAAVTRTRCAYSCLLGRASTQQTR